MSNGAKLVVVLVVIFAAAGLYTAIVAPSPKKPSELAQTPDAPRARSHQPGREPEADVASPRGITAPSNRASAGAARPLPSGSKPSVSESLGGSGAPRRDPDRDAAQGVALPSGDSLRSEGAPTAQPVEGAPVAAPGGSGDRPGLDQDQPRPAPAPAVPAPETPPAVTPAPVRAPPQPSGPRDYTVLDGDTFTSIAEEYLGDARKWVLIARENPGVEPTRISVGQRIRLPAQDAPMPTVPAPQPGSTPAASSHGGSAAPPPPLPAGAVRYEVKQGDTLAAIADRHYGSRGEAAWRRIFEANRETIGDDPSRLRVGMVLVIPPRS